MILASALDQPVWVYLSIPLLAGFIGYITKLLMIEMMFRPLEFKGLVDPWLGWQGQVPRNAARLAATTIDSLQENLLQPEEIIDRIDIDDLLAELEGTLTASIDELADELAARYFPTAWNVMPGPAKRAVIGRIQDRAPDTTRQILDEVRENLDQILDLKHTVIETLVRDKPALVSLFRGLGGDTFGFMRRAGLVFGFAIGVVQAAALMATGEELLLPLFGLVTGGLTDYLALQMIFRPIRPGRFLGLPWQGRFHKLRPTITRDYAGVIARDILTPGTIIEGVLTGPRSDRLFSLVEREVQEAVDASYPTLVRPVVVVALGGREYQDMKEAAARRVIEQLPSHTAQLAGYAERALDLQELIIERMDLMTDEQYEGLLRPIFKDDEWLVVVLGAALGFVFGELQLHLLLS